MTISPYDRSAIQAIDRALRDQRVIVAIATPDQPPRVALLGERHEMHRVMIAEQVRAGGREHRIADLGAEPRLDRPADADQPP